MTRTGRTAPFGPCSRGWRAAGQWRFACTAGPLILTSLLLVYIYVHDLGGIPRGFFCDEVEIGLESQKLASEYLTTGRFPLFYDHYSYVLGALPLYATAPFVLVLGLSEFSVRLASSVCMLASLAVLYWSLQRKLSASSAGLAVLLFALSPIVIHIARINFGHSPAIFSMLLGFALFSIAREGNNVFLSTLAGLLLGISAYGYPAFYVAGPLFVLCLGATELLFNRMALGRYKPALAMLAATSVCYLPIAHTALYNPDFWNRWTLKSPGDASLAVAAKRILWNYLKYYDPAYLFGTGREYPPAEPITRHSVCGLGLLLAVTLPLMVAGLLRFVKRLGKEDQRFFAPFFILLLLYPIPDVLTTRSGYPPYAFSAFANILFVPYIAGYGIEAIQDSAARIGRPGFQIVARYVLSALLAIAILDSGLFFYGVTYKHYPLVASGFWGWQSGPGEMIGYFLRHKGDYDEFYMEEAFNQSEAFLDFYIHDLSLRQKAHIGGLERLDPSRRQLFGVSRAVFEGISKRHTMEVKHVVKYPNGDDAFYLMVSNIEELKRIYSPIESADEALSYALAATLYRAYYADYPTSHPIAAGEVRYLTGSIQGTHVEETDGGYVVFLFDFQEFGCSPWSFYSVPVRVDHDGTIAVFSKTVLYQFDVDDPLTEEREVTCVYASPR